MRASGHDSSRGLEIPGELRLNGMLHVKCGYHDRWTMPKRGFRDRKRNFPTGRRSLICAVEFDGEAGMENVALLLNCTTESIDRRLYGLSDIA